MEVGKGLGVIQRVHLGHEAREQVDELVHLAQEVVKIAPVVDAGARRAGGAFHEEIGQAAHFLWGRQVGEGQVIARLEVAACAEEVPAFVVHERGNRVWETALRVVQGAAPGGLHVDAPVGPHPPEYVV